MMKPTITKVTRSQSGAQRGSNMATTTVNLETETKKLTGKRKTNSQVGRPKKKS